MLTRFIAFSLLISSSTIFAATECSLPEHGRLQSDTRLNPACVYHGSIIIEKSLTLDCQGAVLDGENSQARGLAIGSKSPLTGVFVRNCTFRHYQRQGVLIALRQADDITTGIEPREARYGIAPQNITLEDIHIEQNNTAGLVIGDYVSHVTLRRIIVTDTAGWGMYWDHDSREIELTDSTFQRNGFSHHKQALALDGSSNNRISNNVFRDNARSAIQLYRNCWEFAATNPHSVLREVGANDNLIEGNRFIDENVGIWVAPRMNIDLTQMQCGRQPYFEGKYFEDEALRNRIVGNRFEGNTRQAIIIEDDGSEIRANRFEHSDKAITIGAPLRARVLNRPVINTTLSDNVADDGTISVRWTDRKIETDPSDQ
jgi:parallel beta-helix repeat protein